MDVPAEVQQEQRAVVEFLVLRGKKLANVFTAD